MASPADCSTWKATTSPCSRSWITWWPKGSWVRSTALWSSRRPSRKRYSRPSRGTGHRRSSSGWIGRRPSAPERRPFPDSRWPVVPRRRGVPSGRPFVCLPRGFLDWVGPDYEAARVGSRAHEARTYGPPVVGGLGADLQRKRVGAGRVRHPNVEGRDGEDLANPVRVLLAEGIVE